MLHVNIKFCANEYDKSECICLKELRKHRKTDCERTMGNHCNKPCRVFDVVDLWQECKSLFSHFPKNFFSATSAIFICYLFIQYTKAKPFGWFFDDEI